MLLDLSRIDQKPAQSNSVTHPAQKHKTTIAFRIAQIPATDKSIAGEN